MFLPDFKLKRTRLLSAGVLMLASTAAWSQENQLFAETHSILDTQKNIFTESPATESVNFITVRAALVAASTKDIALEVEPGLIVTAHQLDFKDNTDGTSLWKGTLGESAQMSDEESAKNEVLLVRNGNNITGVITVDGQQYMVTPMADGNHAIVKTDASKFPDYGDDGIEDHSAHGHEHNHDATADSSDDQHRADHSEDNDVSTQNYPIKIRVLTASTSNARIKYPDTLALANLSIARTNEIYKRSNVNIELVNAGILDLNYNENGTLAAGLLSLMTNTSSAIGQPIQKMRDESLADLAVLFSQVKNVCGVAHQNANKARGLSVVNGDCSVSNYTYAHETGHNIGATHEAGFHHTVTPRFRTVMANDCSPTCSRIQNFSNPDVTYMNIPTGTTNQHNNARTLNNRAQNVANFYPAPATWVQSGELTGNGDLPVRQFFEIQLKNRTTGQVLYAMDKVVDSRGMYQWPAETAAAINAYFPANTVRAGERDNNGDIHFIPGSSYRNKIWIHNSLSGQNQLQMTRRTYAETDNQKWFTVGVISSDEQAAVPGTQKQVVLKQSQTDQEVARESLLITESNAGAWSWPEQLARAVNASNTQEMRAGEIQANGSIAVAAGSSYRNQIWVPLAKRQTLTASVETVSAAPVSWNQTGALLGSADLPARQFFQVQLKNLASGKMQSAFSLPFSNTSMYHWPTEIGEAINSRLSANEVRAGERDAASGVITLIKGSHYRNNLWISSILDGKMQLQINQGTYGEALGDKWVSKYSHNELDATPGTTKVVTVRNSTTNSIVKEVKLPITSANFGRYQWISDLTRALNAETPATLRAGEMQADGTLQWIAGSSYRNHIWLPLAQNDQLTVTIETRDANGNLVN